MIALVILGVSMSACGFLGFGGTVKWKEEVQLSDGRVIVIERESQHESGGDEWASNRSGTKPKERRFRFSHSGGSGKLIEWRSTKMDRGLWPEKPLILDFESLQPIVYSIVSTSSGCRSYFKYTYRNGNWVEESLPEHFEKHMANLLVREDFDIPSVVTLEIKRKVHQDAVGWRQYLQVGPARKVCG